MIIFNRSPFNWPEQGVEKRAELNYTTISANFFLCRQKQSWPVLFYLLQFHTQANLFLTHKGPHSNPVFWGSFQTEVDVIEDVEEYQTIPGVIILVLRVVVMLCFLVALRETMMHEFTQVNLIVQSASFD